MAHDPSSSPAARAAVLRQAASIGVATGAYGVSFGALAVTAGLDIWQTMVLSLLLFSGGSQFAVVGVLGDGGSGQAAVATSTLLGVRNGLYGLETSQILRPSGWRRLAAAHLTIDESTAVAVGQPTPGLARLGFWATGLAVFAGWNALTFVGAVLGNAVGDPRRFGLDAAAAAAFCALVWPRLRALDARLVAVGAVLIALTMAPLTPAGVPVLAAVAAAVVVGAGRWGSP